MPKLPDFTALGQRDTGPSRRPIAQIDTSAASNAMAGFGRSIAGVGDAVNDIENQRRAEELQIGGARADADFLTKKIEFEKQFNDEDQDPSSWSPRYQEGIKKIADGAAANIADPRLREIWSLKRQDDMARGQASIELKAKKRVEDGYLATGLESLDNLKKTYVEAADDENMRREVVKAGQGVVEDLRRRGIISDSKAYEFGQTWVKNAAEATILSLKPEDRIEALRGPVQASQASKQAMAFFIERGWTPEQAAGIAGNLMHESSFRTNSNNRGDGSDGSDSIGIAQWNAGRARALKQYAAEQGTDWRDLRTQLEFIDIELRGSERKAGAALKQAATARDAAAAFVTLYERPAGSNRGAENSHGWQNRLRHAETFYADATGGKLPPPPSRSDLAGFIDPERRRVLMQSAESEYAQSRHQESVAAELERKKWVDAKQFDASEGRYTREDARNDFLAGRYKDFEEFEKVAKGYDGFIARGELLGNFNVALADPSFVWNKIDKDHKNMAEEGFKAMGGSMEALETVVGKTGIVPNSAAVAMRGALFSNDPQRVAASMTVANNLMDRNAAIFAGVENKADIENNALSFRHYTEKLGLTADQAAKRVITELSPEYQASVRARVKNEDVDAIIKKQLRVDDLSSLFNEGLPVLGRPAVEFSPEARAGMFSDYAEVFKDKYMETGDVAKAKDLAQQQLSKLWGVTKINGKMGGNLIRYAPEKAPAYAGIPDISDRIANHAIEVIKQETGQDVDRANLIIGPTVQGHTSRAYWSGQSPPYMLSWTDKKGIVHVLNPDPNKGFVLDANDVRQKISAERKAKLEAVTDAGIPTEQPKQITPGMSPREKSDAVRFNQALVAPPHATVTGALKSLQSGAKTADKSVTEFFAEEGKKINESVDARKADDYTQRHIKATPELKAEFDAFEKRMMQAKNKKEEQQIGMELNDRFEQVKREYLSTLDLSKLPALHLR